MTPPFHKQAGPSSTRSSASKPGLVVTSNSWARRTTLVPDMQVDRRGPRVLPEQLAQALHPGVVQGVDRHDDLQRLRPVGRLSWGRLSSEQTILGTSSRRSSLPFTHTTTSSARRWPTSVMVRGKTKTSIDDCRSSRTNVAMSSPLLVYLRASPVTTPPTQRSLLRPPYQPVAAPAVAVAAGAVPVALASPWCRRRPLAAARVPSERSPRAGPGWCSPCGGARPPRPPPGGGRSRRARASLSRRPACCACRTPGRARAPWCRRTPGSPPPRAAEQAQHPLVGLSPPGQGPVEHLFEHQAQALARVAQTSRRRPP